VKPGHALIIRKNGDLSEEEIIEPQERLSCSFERIYFSRGNDMDIYRERCMLGKNLTENVLRAVNYDLENTVFSYIPNTAEMAFMGLVEGLHEYANKRKAEKIASMNGKFDAGKLEEILSGNPRIDKVVIKDAKQRTFITNDESRDTLVNLVYDVTYGTVKKGIDTLVVLDDSIVRGTTLKKSILTILDRLGPKKIIVVSSAPQIRYPDCYGIDMAVLGKFVAFEATVKLHIENNNQAFMEELYRKAKAELEKPKEEQANVVKELYSAFTPGEISDKIASMIRPTDLKAEFILIYQTLEGLHDACPNNRGDWYFSGNFPTPGGNKVSNQAFVNYIEGSDRRAY
jgi:amidophosphoribosyltransferase